MSEPLADATTSSNAATSSILLDGELPRLGGSTPAPPPGSAPLAAPAATVPALASPARPTGPSPMLSAPGSVPVLGSAGLPTLPSLASVALPTPPVAQPPTTPTTTPSVPQPDAGAPALPTLPTAAPATHQGAPALDLHTGSDESTPDAPGEHPMAHLMPQKTVPSEASKRAAEARAAKKAKARKIKIGVAIGALVFAAVVGPPLGKWFVNALNEAGSTSTEVED